MRQWQAYSLVWGSLCASFKLEETPLDGGGEHSFIQNMKHCVRLLKRGV